MDFICWGSFLPLSWTMLKIVIQVRQQIDHLLVIFQWTNRFHYSKRFHHDLITNNQEIFWAFFIWELWSPRKVVKEIGQFAATVRSLLLLHSLSSQSPQNCCCWLQPRWIDYLHNMLSTSRNRPAQHVMTQRNSLVKTFTGCKGFTRPSRSQRANHNFHDSRFSMQFHWSSHEPCCPVWVDLWIHL